MDQQGISELKYDEQGKGFRIINGEVIYQIDEKTQKDRDLNNSINQVRASGMRPGQLLRRMYGGKANWPENPWDNNNR